LALHIQLIDQMRILRNGIDVSGEILYHKGWAVLAYLVWQRDRWLERGRLAELLWPTLPLTSALTNLRQVLNNLRQVLNARENTELLCCERKRITLKNDGGVGVDIDALDPSNLQLPAAVKPLMTPPGYGSCGDFAPGLELPACLEFSTWLDDTRQHVRTRYRHLLKQQCDTPDPQHNTARALASAWNLFNLDKLDEGSAMRLAHLMAGCGDRTGAEAIMRSLEHDLSAELGLRLSPEARSFVQTLTRSPHAHPPCPPSSLEHRPAPTAEPEIVWGTVLYVSLSSLDDSGDDDQPGLDHVMEWLAIYKRATTLASRWGGDVLPLLGTGFLLRFHATASQENTALRGLLTARELMQQQVMCSPLRMGLCTGQIVLHGDAGSPNILGLLPARAQQLAQSAAPGQIQANTALRRLCGVDESAIPGPDHDAHQAPPASANGVQPPLSISTGHPKKLAGRTAALRKLRLLWDHALTGTPQWVVIRGEPGIGKTTLALAFLQELKDQAFPVHVWRCSGDSQHEPFALLKRNLKAYTSNPDHEIATAAARLVSLLDERGHSASRADDGKQPILSATFDFLDSLCASTPTLLVIDDLHYADKSTCELLATYAALFSDQPILLLQTARNDSPSEHAGAAPVVLELETLSERDARKIVGRIDRSSRLSDAQRQNIVRQGGGIPLFIERLTYSALENADLPLIPVRELLQSEMNRLGPFKSLLQAASVLGETFRLDLLSRLAPGSDIDAILYLARSYRLIGDGAHAGQAAFRHALIRDAAYSSLPPSRRRELHGRVANLLSDEADSSPAERATHHECAFQWASALIAWKEAGRAAVAQECAGDALLHFQRAFAIANTPTYGLDDQRQELDLAIARAAMQCEGYGSVTAHLHFLRVYDAQRRLQEPSASERETLFEALSGLYMGSGSQGNNHGLNIAQQLDTIARLPTERLMSCFALGNSLFWRGDFGAARRAQEEGITLGRELDSPARQRYGDDDLGVLLHAFHAWTLSFTGHMEQAEQTAQAGIELARNCGSTHSLCFMLTFAAGVRWYALDPQGVLQITQEAQLLSQRHGFPLWRNANVLFSSWAQARLGGLQNDTVVHNAVEGLKQAYRSGTATAQWVVADTLCELGQFESARDLLILTLQDVNQYDDRYCEPALLNMLACCEDTLGGDGEQLRRQARKLSREQNSAHLLSRFGDTPYPPRDALRSLTLQLR
jgi:DNA-binding SARP family transcriptional activator/tetratricopeptide (TPR) repeat protein